MAIQRKKNVLSQTKMSWTRTYDGCTTLMEAIEAREIEAYEEGNYIEALIFQFSFIEGKIESVISQFGKKLELHPSSLKILRNETGVSRKIMHFDITMSSFISDESKGAFCELIGKLQEYNMFRNDLLHHCGNPKKFKSGMHIEQSVVEAYKEGEGIIRLLTEIKLRKLNNLKDDQTQKKK